jgi:hypothetical protein
MKRLILALLLSWIAILRTERFSPKAIAAPLLQESSELVTEDIKAALSQPFRYLSRGRQSFAFQSEDGKYVVKFFNAAYLRAPFYASLFPKEKRKREKRLRFYREGYRLASKEDSALLYLHLGLSAEALPLLTVTDKASRTFSIDLNTTPFVLQEKGTPFYLKFGSDLQEAEDAIRQFAAILARRIERGVADSDHEIENNFALSGSKLFHLDPGRLFLEPELSSPARVREEIWRSTHRLRKHLTLYYPEALPAFDAAFSTIKPKSLQ